MQLAGGVSDGSEYSRSNVRNNGDFLSGRSGSDPRDILSRRDS